MPWTRNPGWTGSSRDQLGWGFGFGGRLVAVSIVSAILLCALSNAVSCCCGVYNGWFGGLADQDQAFEDAQYKYAW